ncbi:3-oxoacyl-[acyl-carrier-protein] synthase-3 [Neorhodopirellula lusitana]|uniref:3-oxoacyl-[acyl-carrier-protein] synthase-3 n=1 Tax=Neorhodopirellula lusitana TaxID=445327 RepID=A0ABY1QH53_9BACT|nr:3-oxoacyl-ACP synthase III [Neorhodopirellula lusitana]SMP68414.1 3-oxoacyl-[acyl-carrier-protein] synthase-3 [Neorhodopirellula lusitana]
MQFNDVVLAGIGVTIPEECWSSDELENRLSPLYERLRLPEGRLALMSGIAERRVWPAGTMPSGPSVRSGRAAIEAAGIDPGQVGSLIHASVCRDFLEPATASRVHHEMGLRRDCLVYDVSNACLGVLNGAIQIASMIQSGMIQAGVVVGTENSRPLLEATIDSLNTDTSLTRKSVKPAFASLTIGSGSCAWLVCHRDLCPEGTPLEFAVAEANTAHNDLCRSNEDTAGADMRPLMDTDSEKLMAEGIATGVSAVERLLAESGWDRSSIDATVCHQVGTRHRAAMLEAMGLDLQTDAVSFPVLGNTGSVALPLTVATAIERGEIVQGNRSAMLGIGSGINSVMIASTWGKTRVAGEWSGLLESLERVTQPDAMAVR